MSMMEEYKALQKDKKKSILEEYIEKNGSPGLNEAYVQYATSPDRAEIDARSRAAVKAPSATVETPKKRERQTVSPYGTFLGGFSFAGGRQESEKELADEQAQQEAYLQEYRRLSGMDLEKQRAEVEKAGKKAQESKAPYNIRAFGGYDPTQKTEAERQYAAMKAELNKAESLQYDVKGREALDKLTAEQDAALAVLNTEKSDTAKRQAAWQTMQQGGYSDEEISQLAGYHRNIPKRERNAEWYAYVQELARQRGESDPVGGTIMSVPANLVSGVGAIDKTLRKLADPDTPADYHSPAMLPYAYASGVRGEVTKNLQYDHGEGAAFAYGVGTSMLDSAATAALAALGVPPAAASATLGGAAATDAMVAAKDRGLDDSHAIATGVAAGVMESFFEKVSLESLIHMKLPTGTAKQKLAGMLKNAAIQGGIEGSEEMFTDVGNLLADKIINGGLSDVDQRIYQYMAGGMSYQEAQDKVAGEVVKDMAVDFGAGALAGGLMGGGNMALQTAAQHGNELRAAEYQRILQAAQQPEDTALTEAAEKYGAQAEAFRRTYTEGQDVALYDSAYRIAYEYGKAGAKEDAVMQADSLSYLSEAQRKIAYMTGRDAAAFQNGLGEHGSKAWAKVQNADVESKGKLQAGFTVLYQAGLRRESAADVKSAAASALPQSVQTAAYEAGLSDAAASLAREKAGLDFVSSAGSESGLVDNEHAQKMAKEQAGTAALLNTLGKNLGVRIEMVDTIRGGSANGQYIASLNLIQIAADADNAVDFVAAHEVTHRMQDLAPEEYRAYRDHAMSYRARESGEEGAAAYVERYRAMAEEAGVKLTQEEAMDEIAADFTRDMMESGKLFEDFAKENRSAAEKLLDALKAFIAKVKSLFRSKTAQDRAAQDAYGKSMAQLEQCAALWQKAYDAAGKQAQRARVSDAVQQGDTLQYDDAVYSLRVTDKDTLDFLNGQKTIKTYKTMQIVDGKLYPPMAARVDGKYEDASELGKWEMAVERPDLVKDGKFKLDKGKGQGSLTAAYNPYMHSSNLVINDQFSGAYTRNNLVTVECEVPASEMTSGYHAEGAKDGVGWHSWHTGTVAGQIRRASGTERKVFLSRWIKPVRILPDAEVAGMYKDLLGDTGIAVPDNVVTPSLLEELRKAGVAISESGRVKAKTAAREGDGEGRYQLKSMSYEGKSLYEDSKVYNYDFMVSQPDMAVYELPPLSAVKGESGISREVATSLGMKTAAEVGEKQADGTYSIVNRYTGRKIILGKGGLNHSLNAEGGEKSSINRLRTNSRLSAIGGYIVQNAIPVNGLKNKNRQANGTYAMACLANSDNRTVVALVTVEEHNSRVASIDYVDVTHSISGRLSNNESSRSSTREKGYGLSAAPTTAAYTVSIADFLDIVNETYRSILSDDVLRHYGEERPAGGYYSDRVLFQLKSATELEQEVRELKKERRALENRNKVLTERVAKWRGELRRTETPSVRPGDVKKLGQRFLSEYGSSTDYRAIESDMTALGKALMADDVSMDTLRPHARAAAEKIIDGVLVQSESGGELLAIRDHLKNVTLRYTDDGSIPDFKDWRRANRRTLKISDKSGLDVDVAYSELTEMFGEGYFPSTIIHPGDQLLRMSEVLDNVGRIYENPFDGYRDAAVTELSDLLIDGMIGEDVRQSNPTFADRQALELQETKARLTQMLVKTREGRDRQVERMRRHYQEQTKAGRERRNATALRAKIVRHTADLSRKLLTPTDKQHIPEKLRQSVAALLGSINQESAYSYDENGKLVHNADGDPTKRTQAAIALKNAYDEILKSGEALVIDPDLLGSEGAGLLDQVMALGNKRIADMNSEELTTVWQAVRAIEQSVSTFNKNLAIERYAGVQELAEALWDGSFSRKRANRKLALDLYDPYTFFYAYGEAGMQVYRTLRNAQDKQNTMLKAIQAAAEKFMDKEVYKNRLERHEFFVGEAGQRLVLTTGQIMNLYNLVGRGEQAVHHLTVGGVVQPAIQKNGKQAAIERGTENIRLTVDDLTAITGTLSEAQRKVAEGFQRIASGDLAKWGNEASMTVYGYQKFTEGKYWPIKAAQEGTTQNSEKGADVAREIKNMGSAKALTPNASNALEMGDMYDVFAQNASDMIQYSTLLAPMEDINRLYNYRYRDAKGNLTGKNVKHVLTDVYGEEAQKYWRNLMRDVQNGMGSTGTDTTRFIEKMVGGVKGASVGFNLRVVAQQPTAYVRAAAILDPSTMAKGIVGGATEGNGWEKAKKYAPIASIKDTAGFDQSSRYSIAQNVYGGEGGVMDKLNDWSGWAAGKADAVTWGAIWNACEWTVVKEGGYEKGSDAFFSRVAQVFTEVIDQSQVVDGIMQRTQIMRDANGLTKQATAFMGEPLKTLNMFMRSYDAWRFEQNTPKRSAAMKKMTRTIGAVLVTDVVNALVQSLVDAFRDDDKDKGYWERYLEKLTGFTGDREQDTPLNVLFGSNIWDNMDPLGRIPYAKDIKSLMQGFTVSRMDADAAGDFITAAEGFVKSLQGEGKKTPLYAAKQLLTAGSKIFGISVANVGRDVWAIARSIAQESGNVRVMYEMERAIWRLAPDSGNNSRYYKLLYMAMEQDKEAYQYIYEDMKKRGYSDGQLQNGIRSIIKDSGVPDMKAQLEEIGYSAEEAQEITDKWAFKEKYGYDYSEKREALAAGAITRQQLVEEMVSIGGKTREEAEITADVYEWQNEGVDIESSQTYIIKAYEEYGKPNGIDRVDFVSFCQQASQTHGDDLDGDGKADSGTEKAKILKLIDGLPLTVAQKDALYRQQNYAESGLKDAPWH